jgi:hypothetical protein
MSKMKRTIRTQTRHLGTLPLLIALVTTGVYAQAAPGGSGQQVQSDLNARVDLLTQSLERTRAELAESREEIHELRNMLQQLITQTAQRSTAPSGPVPSNPATAAGSSSHLAQAANGEQQESAKITADDWQILNERVGEIQQDKVESSSKYRVKLSGIVLANAFVNSGQFDNVDVPTYALPQAPGESAGSVGGTLRQSIIGLTGVGPDLWGARTAGEVQMDFFGGLPSGYGGETSGIARLRLARIGFDWGNTAVIAGLDVPFFSPNYPSSYMSLATPEFAASGNLWTWTPQVRVEHSIDTDSARLKLQAGFLDAPGYAAQLSPQRLPSPGESSRQPGYALRLSFEGKNEDRPISAGISGIYLPEKYAGGTLVNGWGGMADWSVSFLTRAQLSGEFFVGKGLDDFGGVAPVFPLQPDPIYNAVGAPAIAGVTMIGGWSQLKLKVSERSEFNFGAGIGSRKAAGLRAVDILDPGLFGLWPRNSSFFVNYIFHPRPDLVFSPEFRRIETYHLSGPPAIGDQVGIALGFSF